MRQIQAEGDRPATAAEQAVLARWAGWGAVPGIFETREFHVDYSRFADERAELRELLSDEEYRAAERNTTNAHYTDATYVQSMWNALRELGFDGGNVLEPGCGSGNFIAFAPEGTQVVGVEVEPVTAAIAGKLYPDAQVLAESFADTRAPAGSFDLAVGNVPFGKVSLHDKQYNPGNHSIHDHFTIKALHLVRPGGLVAILTSRYTLDKQSPAARREMSALADLVGAVRLPSGAHRAAAGTEAVTDLLILRRREADRDPSDTTWEQVHSLDLDGETAAVNEYFHQHPHHVLGEMVLDNGLYGRELQVTPTGDIPQMLDAALADIVAAARDRGLTLAPAEAPAAAPQIAPLAALTQHVDGRLDALPDGRIVQVVDGRPQPHKCPKTQVVELRELLELRDTVTALLTAEAASLDDTDEITTLRQRLNDQYDRYAARYGPLNRFTLRRTGNLDPETGEERQARISPPMGGFRLDPDAPAVFALEDFNPATGRATKADIFRTRVIAPRAPQLGADTAEDALAIVLDTHGTVRLEEIARLLGTDTAAAREALGDHVFDVPGADGQLVDRASYLSGNVRAKLAEARAAAADDPRYEINVQALTEVIPRDLGPGEIAAGLGAIWIEARYVEQFLQETLEDRTVKVRHYGGSDWKVKGNKHGIIARNTWGTDYMSAIDLAQRALEQRPIKCYDRGENPGERIFNPEATAAAQAKATELNERFAEWLWEDPERTADLLGVYNERFNCWVSRSYEGVTRSLPGLSVNFVPRPHQIETVARIVNEPAVGIFHEVGAGKTAVMAMGCMELKRLGLVNKPCIVVPNHMLEQVTREYLWTYPQARVLAAGKDDLPADRRRRFVARAATGNWDTIIMTASFFERLQVSVEERKRFMRTELDDLRTKISNAESQAVADGEDPRRSTSVKRMQNLLERLEERLKKKLDGAKDPGVTFEQTGIDYVMRDELHELKNDRVSSNIPDANIDGSERALDFRMKIEYLRRTHGMRVVSGATATPITNSVAEMYVVIRQLRPDILRTAGITDFDSWAATFGKVVTAIELQPTGSGFRTKSRFARFRNIQELNMLWRTFGDVRTGQDLQLPVPLLSVNDSGSRGPETVVFDPPIELQEFIVTLGERAELVRHRAVEPTEDNMLKISSQARAASLDLRLIGEEQSTPGKVAGAADKIAGIYHANRDNQYLDRAGNPHPVPGALQLVFADLGTPGPGWNVYDELRGLLVDRGIPAAQVRFIHEAANDRAKAELFAACREGGVSVLIGSTQRMGVGTNVQDRAIALHHLDCPWRPADVTQREGRILRQGNQNPEVQILRYVVEGSFDAYMWQTVARKAAFIDQVMRGRSDVREIDDIGDDVLDFNTIKAIATGNPLLLDLATAESELAQLERLARSHESSKQLVKRDLRENTEWLKTYTQRLADVDAAIARRVDTRGDAFTMSVGAARFTKRGDAGRALQAVVAHAVTAGGKHNYAELGQVAQLAGFAVTANLWPGTEGTKVSVKFPEIPLAALQMYVDELADADPVGLIRRMEHFPTNLEADRAKVVSSIERYQTEIERAQSRTDLPFPRLDELRAAQAKVAELQKQIAKDAEPEDGPRPPSEASKEIEAAASTEDPNFVADPALMDRIRGLDQRRKEAVATAAGDVDLGNLSEEDWDALEAATDAAIEEQNARDIGSDVEGAEPERHPARAAAKAFPKQLRAPGPYAHRAAPPQPVPPSRPRPEAER